MKQAFRLPVGQTVGNSGLIGRSVKGVEDALTSVPGVGNVIDARRMEGLHGFNQAAFNAGGAPIGAEVNAVGPDAVRLLTEAKSGAYRSALDPVSIDANDPAFISGLSDTVNAARQIPNVENAQTAALAALQSRIGGAVDPTTETLSGRGFQEAYRGLARTGRERAGKDYGHEVGQVMRQGQDALAGALERQNPGAFDAFAGANQANRNLNVLAGAVDRAKANGGIFTP
jgi:hypothetical protein